MTLEPELYNIEIKKGVTFRLAITLFEDDLGVEPWDLTGYSAHLEVTSPTGTSLLTLSDSNGGVILGGPLGTITLLISAVDTQALTWTQGHYVLTITGPGPSADTDPLLRGTVRVKAL